VTDNTKDINESITASTFEFSSLPTNSITVSPSVWSTSPTYTIGTGSTGANAIWTTAVPGTGIGDSAWSAKPSGTLTLQGENADIDLNGKSMRAWMEQIEQRLNILTVNAKLESEWEELRALGEQYRALEQSIIEKMKTWDKLKAQDSDNR
jgi:hypothetical protein